MKTTNGEIYVTKDSLQKLVDVEDMPIKYGFKVLKLVKKLNDEIVIIEQGRSLLISKYGKEIDDKGVKKMGVGPLDESFPEFVSEMNEMMAIEVELDAEKAKVPDSITMSVKDIAALEPFIEMVEVK